MSYACIEIIFLKIRKGLGPLDARCTKRLLLLLIINLARHTNKSMTRDSHGNFLIFSGQ